MEFAKIRMCVLKALIFECVETDNFYSNIIIAAEQNTGRLKKNICFTVKEIPIFSLEHNEEFYLFLKVV